MDFFVLLGGQTETNATSSSSSSAASIYQEYALSFYVEEYRPEETSGIAETPSEALAFSRETGHSMQRFGGSWSHPFLFVINSDVSNYFTRSPVLLDFGSIIARNKVGVQFAVKKKGTASVYLVPKDSTFVVQNGVWNETAASATLDASLTSLAVSVTSSPSGTSSSSAPLRQYATSSQLVPKTNADGTTAEFPVRNILPVELPLNVSVNGLCQELGAPVFPDEVYTILLLDCNVKSGIDYMLFVYVEGDDEVAAAGSATVPGAAVSGSGATTANSTSSSSSGLMSGGLAVKPYYSNTFEVLPHLWTTPRPNYLWLMLEPARRIGRLWVLLVPKKRILGSYIAGNLTDDESFGEIEIDLAAQKGKAAVSDSNAIGVGTTGTPVNTSSTTTSNDTITYKLTRANIKTILALLPAIDDEVFVTEQMRLESYFEVPKARKEVN
ncbi:unnamed protein product, partial [Amoebophrya sp. A25]